MTKEKGSVGRGAWRPSMPRKGKSMLLDAREIAEVYGWTDDAIARIQAGRDAGWTLQEIGEILGCSREFIRQLYERDVDPSAAVTGFPQKPSRPKIPNRVPITALRRNLVTPEEIAELIELQRLAKLRRSNNRPERVAAAEELWSRVDELVTIGVPVSWLSRQMGLSACTLRAGLSRYGYVRIPPSQPQRLTGGAA